MRAAFVRTSTRRRVTNALLIAAMTTSIIGSVAPGEAATDWNCRFDPAGGTMFRFASSPGLGNDTLRIAGGGLCTDRPISPCGLVPRFGRPPCDNIFSGTRSASISGFATESAGQNTLHFGRCDADPRNNPFFGTFLPDPLIATIDLTIAIVGRPSVTRRAVWGDVFELCSAGLGGCVDFPGPAPQVATLSAGETRDGRLSLFTRVGGRCPGEDPPGNYTANLIDVTFTS